MNEKTIEETVREMERSPEVRAYLTARGKLANSRMTPEARRARAIKAGKARAIQAAKDRAELERLRAKLEASEDAEMSY